MILFISKNLCCDFHNIKLTDECFRPGHTGCNPLMRSSWFGAWFAVSKALGVVWRQGTISCMIMKHCYILSASWRPRNTSGVVSVRVQSPPGSPSAEPVDGHSVEHSGYLLKSRIFSAPSRNAVPDPRSELDFILGVEVK